MRRFASLVEDLSLAPDDGVRLAHLRVHFHEAPDPDRGWALAALAGRLGLPAIAPRRLRALAEDRVDVEIFRLSREHVGEVGETVALIWPAGPSHAPRLGAVIDALSAAGSRGLAASLAGLFDIMDPAERRVLVDIATGRIARVVSPSLLREALAENGDVPLSAIEEAWASLAPPFGALFAWLDGGPAPVIDPATGFRPVMRAQTVGAADLSALDPAGFVAEWKWRGLRVQAVAAGGRRRLFSAGGDDISHAFPEVIDRMQWEGVVDAVLMQADGGRAGALRLFDLLHDGASDLRDHPLSARRAGLEGWMARHAPAGADLSPLIGFGDWRELRRVRGAPPVDGAGLILKRRDALYAAGRAAPAWLDWPLAPRRVRLVLLYAEQARRGGGLLLTLGAWSGRGAGRELVPVGRAAAPDEARDRLDDWVRENATDRFGPVRAVPPEVVVDASFAAADPAPRRKAGLVLDGLKVEQILCDADPAAAAELEEIRATRPDG